jgi:hypothetical protein
MPKVMSKRRAGRAVRERVRAERWVYARLNWRMFVVIAFLALLMAAVSFYLTDHAFVRGLGVGVSGSFLVVGLWYPFVLNNSHARGLGGEAERFTSEELRKLDRRRWVVVDDVLFDRWNVDHVLIGPGLVYAVESKWRGNPITGPELEEFVGQAVRGASKIRRLLRSRGVAIEVAPLLVLWGPGSPALEDLDDRRDDVLVLCGPEAKRWRPRVAATARGDRVDARATDVIRRYVERRDQHLAVHGH